MGIVTGYIALVCLVMLVMKFIARKANNRKINLIFARLHKPVSCIFILICIIHLVLVIPVLSTRNLLVVLSGFLGAGIVILLILLCHAIRDGRRTMRWHRVMTLLLLTAVICHIITYYIDFAAYKNNIKGIEITEVNFSTIPDGKYVGDFDAGYIYAKVQVTVQDGTITDIELLKHKNERGQKAESIIGRIKSEQRLDVDAVSGATNSSLVIKKAIENALQ